MTHNADKLSQALAIVEQAHDALAEAASILRNAPEHDDLASSAMRLEAYVTIFATEITRAVRRATGRGDPPAPTHAR